MNGIISYNDVESKIIEIRGEKVILDSDVAKLYGVETKQINQAVSRNPDKFPEGYIITMDTEEWSALKSQFATSNEDDSLRSQFSTLDEAGSLRSQIVTLDEDDSLRSNFLTLDETGSLKSQIVTSKRGGKNKLPKAFTEKGLYMLATILKSPVATQTTIAIVEAFANLRELNRIINVLPAVQNIDEQKTLAKRSGELVAGIFEGNAFNVVGDEISFELNLPLMKVKRTVKREKQDKA